MATNINPSGVKIWYRYLQLALNNGIPINRDFYDAWGTNEELSQLKFNTWWKLKGKSLFDQHQAKVSVVKSGDPSGDPSGDTGLTIYIPDHLTAKEANKMINKLVVARRGTRRIKSKGAYTLTGQFDYERLIQYQRYLTIELDPKYNVKTTEEKATALIQQYAVFEKQIKKRNATLGDTRDKKGRRLANQIKARSEQSFIREDGKLGIDAKKINKWLLNGKHLMLNAAEGKFPGGGYHGSALKAKLVTRLKKLGIETIGSTVKNKGGRRRIRIIVTKEEKNRKEKLSLSTYGSTRGKRFEEGTGEVNMTPTTKPLTLNQHIKIRVAKKAVKVAEKQTTRKPSVGRPR